MINIPDSKKYYCVLKKSKSTDFKENIIKVIELNTHKIEHLNVPLSFYVE